MKIFNEMESAQIKDKHPDVLDADGNIALESPTAKNLLETYQPPKAFDKIGYARPLGGFFYQFFYGILGIALSTGLYRVLHAPLGHKIPAIPLYPPLSGNG